MYTVEEVNGVFRVVNEGGEVVYDTVNAADAEAEARALWMIDRIEQDRDFA